MMNNNYWLILFKERLGDLATKSGAAAFYQKGGITKQHAVNTLAGSITKRVEGSIAEGWDVKGYERNYNYPQTAISSVMHDKILKIGESGFKLSPTLDSLKILL